ncbi:MAG: hypothetical protein LBO20_01640, partial [Bifidobacteriaceae bacterium]|nr:hypothetical protein [Bifidobacteriaceae bacterium]
MNDRHALLNQVQIDVLRWIEAGCPDGVYADWSHRVTARVLHNRGLAIVRGHGAGWSATITDSGAHYLKHGTYLEAKPSPGGSSVEDKAPPSRANRGATRQSPPNLRKPRVGKVKKAGPVDQMMEALRQAEDHRIVIEHREASRYQRLAGVARRYGRIPDGMQITVAWNRDQQSVVTLEPLPEWKTKVLEA